eukprot:TRINITY_DN2855_c0_g1_i3.p1 TRINITY_DN2855_c0_g1~~TRINITY_DN2855_c0_g1_i3.p1  ORF type:complete len:241 (-),score=33.84 TRINITY_DN2855_c0_g1_i3:547-1269(-)
MCIRDRYMGIFTLLKERTKENRELMIGIDSIESDELSRPSSAARPKSGNRSAARSTDPFLNPTNEKSAGWGRENEDFSINNKALAKDDRRVNHNEKDLDNTHEDIVQYFNNDKIMEIMEVGEEEEKGLSGDRPRNDSSVSKDVYSYMPAAKGMEDDTAHSNIDQDFAKMLMGGGNGTGAASTRRETEDKANAFGAESSRNKSFNNGERSFERNAKPIFLCHTMARCLCHVFFVKNREELA